VLARRIRSPWIWCLVALLVRVAYLGIGPGFGVQPYSDSVDYHRLAAHLAEGRGFSLGPEDQLYPTTFRPPLLPMLVAPVYALFGPHHLLALLLQIVLSALAVPLAAQLARESLPSALGARTAWITAPLVALWPPLIYFSGVLGTETLAILLSLLALLLAVRLFVRGGTALALATGVSLGLAALARPTALPLAALLGAWVFLLAPRPFGRRAQDALLVALGLLLCVLPWTLRNHAVTGRWLAITSGGGNALYDSNNPIVIGDPAYRGGSLSLRQVEPYAEEFKGLDEVGIDSLSAVRARAFLVQHRDLWPRMAGWKLARFFRLTRDAGGAAGVHPARDPITWTWGLLAPFALVGFGFALARPRAPAAALALAVIAQTALAVVYWGSLRMRGPIEPVLIILGAATLARLWARLKNYSSR
jgi:hypothetical protein